jgi:FtsH-binding integral membrane protein
LQLKKTLSLTYLLAVLSAFHKIQLVAVAVGITLFISVGVTLFAIQTRFDFTAKCWMVVLTLTLALFGFAIAMSITAAFSSTAFPILQAVYGGIGALLMAIFLAIDTQMLIGGKKYKYSEEDYVNAALQIYIDISYMFMYLLQIFGAGKK